MWKITFKPQEIPQSGSNVIDVEEREGQYLSPGPKVLRLVKLLMLQKYYTIDYNRFIFCHQLRLTMTHE